MIEANIHLRPLHTSTSYIYTVFELLFCCLKAIWLHPYTVTPAKLAPDLGSQGHLWTENDAITSWLRLISTSNHFIHPYYTYTKCLSHWYVGTRPHGSHLIPNTIHVGPRFGKSGSLVEWKWCHNVMVEANIHLRPLHTSILPHKSQKMDLQNWKALIEQFIVSNLTFNVSQIHLVDLGVTFNVTYIIKYFFRSTKCYI